MQEKYIKLNSVEDIKTFVRAAENCPFDIDVSYNRVYIDGKSFLGLMGMDLNQILRVQYSGEDAAFEAMLEGFAVGKNHAA
nr:HPr family phosphocarrier protein [uncultured Stomatobaculum sp.]